jgi:uncharacterized membrane protein YhhN
MLFLYLSIAFALANWYFEFRENRKGIYATKPPMMICLILWLLISVPDIALRSTQTGLLPLWFLLGLCFGLIGDVFLMWPKRFFLPGLLAFLINQVLYLIGFGTYYNPDQNTLLQSILYIIFLVILLIVVYLLFRGMDKRGTTRMKLPVGIYALIISMMVVAAIETFFYNWPLKASIFISVGALSFYVSDIMNAWSRFVGDIRLGRVKIMSTYHLAQVLITIGIVFAVTLTK